MRHALQRLRLHRVAAIVTAAAVLVFAFGSSSVPSLHDAGQTGRWIALGALVVVGLAYAAARDRLPAVPVLPATLAAGLGLLALASTAWSVQPRTSIERGVSFGALLLAAGLLALASAGRPAERRALVAGLVGGSALVAIAGLLVLAAHSPYAVLWWQPGGPPTRLRFLGENPNTVPLLFSLSAPGAAWLLFGARTRRGALAALAALGLIAGELMATQSRGAVVAMAVGLAVVALLQPAGRRRRIAHLAAAAAVIGLALGVTSLRFTAAHAYELPPGLEKQQVPDAQTATTSSLAQCSTCPLQTFPGRIDDIGNPFFTGKYAISNSAVSSSGRLAAWKGAFHTGSERPFAGWGFGTEDRVFVDRYYFFVGSRPENGYLGFYLQLGVLGVLGFVGLGAVLLWRVVRVLRHPHSSDREVAVGLAGIGAAGYAAAATQSFPYSVGNIASLTLWFALLGLATVTWPRRGGEADA